MHQEGAIGQPGVVVILDCRKKAVCITHIFIDILFCICSRGPHQQSSLSYIIVSGRIMSCCKVVLSVEDIFFTSKSISNFDISTFQCCIPVHY